MSIQSLRLTNVFAAVVSLLAFCGLPSSAWGQALPGDLLVAEFSGGTVVEVSAGGDVSAAPPFATGLSGPTHLCVGPGGDVFVTEFSSGQVTIITAGGAAPAAFATGLSNPIALSCSASEVLVSEWSTGEVTDITAGGSFAGSGAFATGLGTPIDLYRDTGGTLWVADRDGRVLDISAGGDFSLAPGFASSVAGFLFGLGEYDADLLVAQNDYSDPNALDDRAVIAFTAGGDLGLLARTPMTAPEDILNVPGLGLFVSEVSFNSGRIYEISGGYAVGAPFATGITGGAGFAGMVYIEGCPDGIVQGAEECDDDNATDGDGCTSACVAEVCGDSVVQGGLGEECDDGNTVSDDGCSEFCLDEFCGDGVLQTGLGEECDDGNMTSGDGCSALCVDEFGGYFVIINNGLAPPNPANVIDAGLPTGYHDLLVRNVGCDGWGVCSLPGAPTTVLVTSPVLQASVRDTSTLLFDGDGPSESWLYLEALDSSSLVVDGDGFWFDLYCEDMASCILGSVSFERIRIRDSASFIFDGSYSNAVVLTENARGRIQTGWIGGAYEAVTLSVSDAASVIWSGGRITNEPSVEGNDDVEIQVGDVGSVMIVGDDFSVDGIPRPWGSVPELDAELEGTLLSGEAVRDGPGQGIELVRAPTATIALAPAIPEDGFLLINNGLDPNEPMNRLDWNTEGVYDGVLVENVGCNSLQESPCASPGAPSIAAVYTGGDVAGSLTFRQTSYGGVAAGVVERLVAHEFALLNVVGGQVTDEVTLYDSSDYLQVNGEVGAVNAADHTEVVIAGGQVAGLVSLAGNATAEVRSGQVGSGFEAQGSSEFRWTGGVVGGTITAFGSSAILVEGNGFAVDGVPVPYGVIAAPDGTLTGLLANEDPVAVDFFHDGSTVPGTPATGSIYLPEPDSLLLLASGGLALAGARARGVRREGRPGEARRRRLN